MKRIQYNSPIILTYFFLSLLVLLLSFLTRGATNDLLFVVYKTKNIEILNFFRVFSHILGHANFEHFFNNFILILLLGPLLEEKYGSKKMLFMILFTAFITGIFQIMFFNNGLLGASGIVFMLIALTPISNFQQGKIPLTFIIVIIIFLGQEIFLGLTVDDQISRITHIIGGLCGAVLGFSFNINKNGGI